LQVLGPDDFGLADIGKVKNPAVKGMLFRAVAECIALNISVITYDADAVWVRDVRE
jgi:hypothetical protein